MANRKNEIEILESDQLQTSLNAAMKSQVSMLLQFHAPVQLHQRSKKWREYGT